MNRTQLLERLKTLAFDKNDYWLITGGAMVLYGLRAETGDIDLGCTREMADALEASGLTPTILKDGTRKFLYGEDIEIFEEWLYDRVELVEGVPVISLNGLLAMKKTLGREKDLRDVRLIEERMQTANRSAIIHHYDLLIDENNDPVHDPKPLREYMNKWDGDGFIDRMELNAKKTVLEIGVGTGRLAVRVAPLCGSFCGIDLSSKTIERGRENLASFNNVNLICRDFLSYDFAEKFDVIYSSLTFMHIADKQNALCKIATLLNTGGRLVLSIDKNPSDYIDIEINRIAIYPDTPDAMAEHIKSAGLSLIEQYETEFGVVFVAENQENTNEKA